MMNVNLYLNKVMMNVNTYINKVIQIFIGQEINMEHISVDEKTLPMITPSKKERWYAWHLKNPNVYHLFKHFTFEALRERKHKHLGAWLVVNRIRWETSISTTGEDFKISNNFIAYYARLFMEEYPEHKGLFRTKLLKEERHNGSAY
jgi:hypothetical protein